MNDLNHKATEASGRNRESLASSATDAALDALKILKTKALKVENKTEKGILINAMRILLGKDIVQDTANSKKPRTLATSELLEINGARKPFKEPYKLLSYPVPFSKMNSKPRRKSSATDFYGKPFVSLEEGPRPIRLEKTRSNLRDPRLRYKQKGEEKSIK